MSRQPSKPPSVPSRPPARPKPVRGLVGALLDHLFDAVPALLLLGFLVATSHPFKVEFDFAAAFRLLT